MSDGRLHYAACVADLINAAHLGQFRVELTTDSGAPVAGVPGPVRLDRSGHQFDESGYARTFRIDDAIVNLDEIATLTVHRPR